MTGRDVGSSETFGVPVGESACVNFTAKESRPDPTPGAAAISCDNMGGIGVPGLEGTLDTFKRL